MNPPHETACDTTAGGALCSVGTNGDCEGTVYTVQRAIPWCPVDVCFLLDGSGSMAQSAWEIEANVVDSMIRSIGEVDPSGTCNAPHSPYMHETHIRTPDPDSIHGTRMQTI